MFLLLSQSSNTAVCFSRRLPAQRAGSCIFLRGGPLRPGVHPKGAQGLRGTKGSGGV